MLVSTSRNSQLICNSATQNSVDTFCNFYALTLRDAHIVFTESYKVNFNISHMDIHKAKIPAATILIGNPKYKSLGSLKFKRSNLFLTPALGRHSEPPVPIPFKSPRKRKLSHSKVVCLAPRDNGRSQHRRGTPSAGLE